MSLYGNGIWDDIKWQYRYGGVLVRIILVNIAVFVLLGLLGIIDFFAHTAIVETVVKWFASYSSLTGVLTHPWGIITGMFLHDGFFHLLYNMLFLYWFGVIIRDYLGKDRVAPVFFLGGIFSSLVSIAVFYLFNYLRPGFIPDMGVGASAGVMSLVLAAATLVPDNEISFLIIGRVKIKWIALVYVVLDIISIPQDNAGGHFAHLAGALFGWVYIRQLRNGTDLARPFYALLDFVENRFSKKKKLRVEYRRPEKTYANAGNTRSARPQNQPSRQERLDEILDKIGKSGYDSLNKEEKDFLFQISKEE